MKKISKDDITYSKENETNLSKTDTNEQGISSVGMNSNGNSGTLDVNHHKKGVSIAVTKALVLLGFDSWSSLEPGN